MKQTPEMVFVFYSGLL